MTGSQEDQASTVALQHNVNLGLPAAGEPVYAWCGPQPNQRLLLNYGIVDESNPHDRLQLTATIPSSDRL